MSVRAWEALGVAVGILIVLAIMGAAWIWASGSTFGAAELRVVSASLLAFSGASRLISLRSRSKNP